MTDTSNLSTGYEGGKEKVPPSRDPEAVPIVFDLQRNTKIWGSITAQIRVYRVEEQGDGFDASFVPVGIVSLQTEEEYTELKKRLEL